MSSSPRYSSLPSRDRPPLPQGPRRRQPSALSSTLSSASTPPPWTPSPSFFEQKPPAVVEEGSAPEDLSRDERQFGEAAAGLPASSSVNSPASPPESPASQETTTSPPQSPVSPVSPALPAVPAPAAPVAPAEPPVPPPVPPAAPAPSLPPPAPVAASSSSAAPLPPAQHKFVALPPPPKVDFDTPPIPWKGLPLDAAQWTYSSGELQQLVSRAIRASARESFIRLLSLEHLDHILPNELARLATARAVTQSKFRFQVQRRTMTLQALNSCAAAPGDGSALATLTRQLGEIAGACDVLTGELVRIADEVAQVQRLQDVHWAGALAMALRKLNGSYGKRTQELVAAKERVTQLEAELAEAWAEAEKMAREMDAMEETVEDTTGDLTGTYDSDDDEAIIGTAEVVQLPNTPTLARMHSVDQLKQVLTVEEKVPKATATSQSTPTTAAISLPGPSSARDSTLLAASTPIPDSPIVETESDSAAIPESNQSDAIPAPESAPTLHAAEVHKATPENTPLPESPAEESAPASALEPEPETDPEAEAEPEPDAGLISDTATVRSFRSGRSARSVRSTRSTRSTRHGEPSRTSMVSAAKTRSHRTSMGSLRLPHRRRPSTNPLDYISPPEMPPLPPLPTGFAPSFTKLPFRAAKDDINVVRRRRVPAPRLGSLDDTDVMMRREPRMSVIDSIDAAPPRRSSVTLDSTGTYGLVEDAHRFIDFTGSEQLPDPLTPPRSVIPSIWRDADRPAVPRSHNLARAETTAANSKPPTPYRRFKTLTQRYSLPFQKLAGSASVGALRKRPQSSLHDSSRSASSSS